MTETTIPILPCASIDDVLDFYRALGFEVTYTQQRPNTYAVVERGGIHLHFFTMKDYDPAQSYSTCYVTTTDVDALYRAFTGGLKRTLGRVPTRGIPRIGALRDLSYGTRQFIVTDPGGNAIRIGQPIEAPAPPGPGERPSRLARALETATALGDSKGDDTAAARVLDLALAAADEQASPRLRARALILRADLALRLDDLTRARALLDELDRVELTESDRTALHTDLTRAHDLSARL
jgi:hypothetical protein